MKIKTLILFFSLNFCIAQTKTLSYPKVLTDFFEKNKFDTEKVYTFSFKENPEFVKEVEENNLASFYGVLYKDKFYSAKNLENAGCYGQHMIFIQNSNLESIDGVFKNQVKMFDNIHVNPEKKVIVFFCSYYSSKSILKHLVKPIYKEIKKDSIYDYIMLVIK